jgi:hypothetical protein
VAAVDPKKYLFRLAVQRIDQRIQARLEETDYMTTFADSLEIQNGSNPANLTVQPATQAALRFIRDGRDLSHYVRMDVLYQAYMVAGVILLNGVTLKDWPHAPMRRLSLAGRDAYCLRSMTSLSANGRKSR